MKNNTPMIVADRMWQRIPLVLFICLCALPLLSSCGTSSTRMDLPSAHEIQSTGKLPIDGTWELQFQSKTGAVFKIEGRKMYVYANYGPAAWHGMVIAKNIWQINPLKYGCEYATVSRNGKKSSFGRGEIEILSENFLQVKFFPNPVTGQRDIGIDKYKKMRLEDEAWFLSEISRGKK